MCVYVFVFIHQCVYVCVYLSLLQTYGRTDKGSHPPLRLYSVSCQSPYEQGRLLFDGRLICDTYKLSQEALGSRVR